MPQVICAFLNTEARQERADRSVDTHNGSRFGAQRAHGREGWPARVRARLRARARRHRLEAAQLVLSFRAITGLDQEQEPNGARREAGSRRGLGPLTGRGLDASLVQDPKIV